MRGFLARLNAVQLSVIVSPPRKHSCSARRTLGQPARLRRNPPFRPLRAGPRGLRAANFPQAHLHIRSAQPATPTRFRARSRAAPENAPARPIDSRRGPARARWRRPAPVAAPSRLLSCRGSCSAHTLRLHRRGLSMRAARAGLVGRALVAAEPALRAAGAARRQRRLRAGTRFV